MLRDSLKSSLWSDLEFFEVVVTDNDTQFVDKNFQKLMARFSISHGFTSVEHRPTNGQAATANRVILRALKHRLDEAKGNWFEELPHVLWDYRTTPHSSTGESPFWLTYGSEVVIPVKIGELTWRTSHSNSPEINKQAIQEEIDLEENPRSGFSPRSYDKTKNGRPKECLPREAGPELGRSVPTYRKNRAQGLQTRNTKQGINSKYLERH